MNLIKTFGLVVKPIITKGKGMMNPRPTKQIFSDVFCLRDKDVNCFLIKGDKGYIAIDSGYQNSQNTSEGLKMLGIAPEQISDVFLTHLDIDHAGGMCAQGRPLYPNAEIHISAQEEKYLTGAYSRKTIAGYRCKLPIALPRYKVFSDRTELHVDGISVLPVAVPGHTLGHTAFLINGIYLFSGDCIIANEEGGWLFYDFWNQDPVLNRESVQKLRGSNPHAEYVLTAHSGCLTWEKAFRHTDKAPDWRRKGFVFCREAEKNLYR